MNTIKLYGISGNETTEKELKSLLPVECRAIEIDLPEGIENVRLLFEDGCQILHFRQVEGFCGFWYDLSFQTDAFRLGHNLFLVKEPGASISGEDFRFHTTKIRLSLEIVSLSEEATEALLHDCRRLSDDRDTLEKKWKYQIQVYDDKVQEVVQLEKDKVALNETIEELRQEVDFWRDHYRQMEGSLSWRVTEPIRSMSAAAKRLKNRGPLAGMQKEYLAKKRQRAEAAKTGYGMDVILSDSSNASSAHAGIGTGDGMQKVSLLADVQGLSDADLFAFLSAVWTQTYPNLELVLSGDAPVLAWLAKQDPDIRVVSKTVSRQGSRNAEGQQSVQEQQNAQEQSNAQSLRELLKAATGDLLGFLTPGDSLSADAIARCVSAVTGKKADLLYTDSALGEDPLFKPDFSPDYLRSCNYIRGFVLAKKELFARLDVEENVLGGVCRYGLLLRLTELAEEGNGIFHLAEKLFTEQKKELPGVLVAQENEASLAALRAHLARKGLAGEPELIDKKHGLFHVRYALTQHPLISILIPNKDHAEDLRRCIDSILRLSTYRNIEIVVVENNSAKKETFDLYRELTDHYAANFSGIVTEDGGRTLKDSAAPVEEIEIRVEQWTKGFNFSEINNFGVPKTKGEYLLLLNNDMEVLMPNWIEEMLMFAERPDVGAVGAKLLYPDDTIQHAGVIIGLGGVAAHSHLSFPKDAEGYMHRLKVVQNLSAVTAACLLMRKSIYEEIGGMDPLYQVAFNDADFCMRIRTKGYRIVFTPFAQLRHDESKSRGIEDTPEKAERFESEITHFKEKWPEILADGDPYYNPNLTTREENFAVKD